VFDSPDAASGQIIPIGRAGSRPVRASAATKTHNNKQSKGYKSRPEFGGCENSPH
jgi:hypothetical protein